MKSKRWYDYMYWWPVIYFTLGFFNILFAWLGVIEFMLPMLFAIFGGNKYFCNNICGRGQLFTLLSKRFKFSRGILAPKWLSSKLFRYAFLVFFMAVFGNIIFQTWLVYGGTSSLRETLKLFWVFSIPFEWTYTNGMVSDWVAQFSFGLYSLMLTSEIIGLIVMMLYRPRTWCSFCPMGTMTQMICRLEAGKAKPLP